MKGNEKKKRIKRIITWILTLMFLSSVIPLPEVNAQSMSEKFNKTTPSSKDEIYGIASVTNAAKPFSPRTTAPNKNNSYYYSSNPFCQAGYPMPNCTAYAYGRAWEILGSKPRLSTGNAGEWWNYNIKNGCYNYGKTPKLGAIACWDNYDSYHGHVAVVENISGNSVLISESHYNGTNFDTKIINANSSNYLTSKRFLGYIYIDDFTPLQDPFRYSVDSAPANGTTYHSTSDIIHVSGWALTTYGNGSGVTCVNLCVNGKDVHNCSRSQRDDVANVYPDYPNANSGFSCDVSAGILNPGANTISLRAYATNVNQNDILIGDFGECTVYYNPDYNLDGCIDSAEGGKGSVTVSGWALDKDNDSSIDVHVYIGGEAGSGAPVYGIRADKERKDIGEIFGKGDYHGFSSTIPTDRTGQQTLYFYAIDPSGVGSKLLGSKTVTIQEDKSPIGVIDNAIGETDSVTVSGWAYDADDTSKPVWIHIYAGGPAGSGTFVGNILADKEHGGLKNEECGVYHGYLETISTNLTGTQTLYFYAIGLNGGNNGDLGSKTVNIKQGKSPQGSFDTARGGKGSVLVDGWAFDEDDTSKALDIHVYIGDEAGSGAPGYVISADKERTDVGSIYNVGDYHGYNTEITTSMRGTQEVYVYAIDAGSNQPNVLLGHKTVTIAEPDASEEHVHTYTEEITKQASCTEQGERRYTCTCGDSYCEIIEKLPHTEVTDRAQAATCEKKGLTEGSHCSVCGAITKEQEITEKLNHKNTIVKFQKDANCVSAGYTGDTYCADCGIKLANGSYTKQLEHTMDGEGIVLKNATESEAGITIFTCTVCETTAVKIIPAIGSEQLKEDKNHSHTYTTETISMPTYYSPGEAVHVCACGEYFEESIPMSTSPETKYTITYHLDGGTNNALNPQEYTGKTVITLHNPSREGYTFQGWYTDSTYEDEVTAIGKGSSGNLEFYAKWKETGDSEADMEKVTGIQLDTVSKLLVKEQSFQLKATVIPSTASAENLIWESSDTDVATVTKDGTITAHDSGTALITVTAGGGSGVQAACSITVPYNITYHLNQGSNNGNNPSYYYRQKLTFADPVRNGCTFGGWYMDSEFEYPITSIEKNTIGDLELYAKWEKEGESDADLDKITGIRLDASSKLLQRGKTFNLSASITPSTASADKLHWESSDPEVAEVTTNGMVVAIAPGTAIIKVSAKDDSSVQASCTITVPYHISYKLNRGSNNKSNPSYYYRQKITLKPPTRKGYTFGGWYTDSKYKKKVTSIAQSSEKDITLYAKWNKVTVKKASIKKITNISGKKAKINISKVSGAKGYKILYSADKKMKKNVKAANVKKTNATLTKLKKGKTYYVKVCAYKIDSKGSKIYGAYSKAKKVNIKK